MPKYHECRNWSFRFSVQFMEILKSFTQNGFGIPMIFMFSIMCITTLLYFPTLFLEIHQSANVIIALF